MTLPHIIGGEITSQELNDNFSYLDQKIDVHTETVTYGIPSEFPDLQTAIDTLSQYKHKQGVRIILMIESGHQLTRGVSVENGDYSFFWIQSEDAEVQVDPNFTGHLLYGAFANMPVLDCLIDMNGLGGSGYYADESSRGKITAGNGVKNAGEMGLYANRGSIVFANSTIFTGANSDTGITARRGSAISAEGADVSGSATYGASAAIASFLAATNITANDCGRHGVRADEASVVNANGATIKNAGANGVYAWRGSTINVKDAIVTNATDNGIYAVDGSTINAEGADASGAGIFCIYAYRSSNINAQGAIANNAGNQGVRSDSGSTINFRNGTATGSQNEDLAVISGSFLNAAAATYDTTNVSNLNEITPPRGIIWG